MTKMSDPNDVRFARGLWHTWWPHVRDAWREFVEGRQPLEQYYDQLLEEHGADDFPAWSWDEDESDEAVSLLERSRERHRTAGLNDAPRGGSPHAALANAVAHEDYYEAAKIRADIDTMYAELEDAMCSCRGVCTCMDGQDVDHLMM